MTARTLGIIACSVVAALACALWPTTSQAQVEDIKGWHKTEWGMSPEELIETYGDQIEIGRRGWPYIDDFKIYGVSFIVSFGWNDNRDALESVMLFASGDSLLRSLNEKISASLIQKYGQPEVLEDSKTKGKMPYIDAYQDNMALELRWVFPSTIVNYTYISLGGQAGKTEWTEMSVFRIQYDENQSDRL